MQTLSLIGTGNFIISRNKRGFILVNGSSMVSIAAFGPCDRGSNPSWFALSNSNQKLSFTNITSMWFSSRYCNPAMGDTLVDVDQ